MRLQILQQGPHAEADLGADSRVVFKRVVCAAVLAAFAKSMHVLCADAFVCKPFLDTLWNNFSGSIGDDGTYPAALDSYVALTVEPPIFVDDDDGSTASGPVQSDDDDAVVKPPAVLSVVKMLQTPLSTKDSDMVKVTRHVTTFLLEGLWAAHHLQRMMDLILDSVDPNDWKVGKGIRNIQASDHSDLSVAVDAKFDFDWSWFHSNHSVVSPCGTPLLHAWRRDVIMSCIYG